MFTFPLLWPQPGPARHMMDNMIKRRDTYSDDNILGDGHVTHSDDNILGDGDCTYSEQPPEPEQHVEAEPEPTGEPA